MKWERRKAETRRSITAVWRVQKLTLSVLILFHLLGRSSIFLLLVLLGSSRIFLLLLLPLRSSVFIFLLLPDRSSIPILLFLLLLFLLFFLPLPQIYSGMSLRVNKRICMQMDWRTKSKSLPWSLLLHPNPSSSFHFFTLSSSTPFSLPFFFLIQTRWTFF